MDERRWSRKLLDGLVHVLRSWPFKLLVFLLIAGIGLWFFRVSVMRAAGSYLIAQDKLSKADAIYVLGGGSKDRGGESARLYQEGWSDHVIFLGENVPSVLELLDTMLTEAQTSQIAAFKAGLPANHTELLEKGTSTQEEAMAILDHSKQAGYDTVIVVSHKFHLRRIRQVFRKRFKKVGITVVIRGAENSRFDEHYWWRNEEGLLMFNNEYVKQVYYLVKH